MNSQENFSYFQSGQDQELERFKERMVALAEQEQETGPTAHFEDFDPSSLKRVDMLWFDEIMSLKEDLDEKGEAAPEDQEKLRELAAQFRKYQAEDRSDKNRDLFVYYLANVLMGMQSYLY